jgi:hypothetical protein
MGSKCEDLRWVNSRPSERPTPVNTPLLSSGSEVGEVQTRRRELVPVQNRRSRLDRAWCGLCKEIQWGFWRHICERIRAEAARLVAFVSFFRSLLRNSFCFSALRSSGRLFWVHTRIP